MSQSLSEVFQKCHTAAVESGWWQEIDSGTDLRELINNPRSPMEKMIAGALVAQKIALSHGELSEGLEGHRKGRMDDHLPHRPNLEVELADAVIRIADLAGALNFDLAGAISEKMEYNARRADHKISARKLADGKKY